MTKKNNIKYILPTLSFVFMIFLAVYFTIYDSQRIEKLHKEYKEIKNEDGFNGNIIDLYTEKGGCFISLDNEKFMLKTSVNNLYSKRYLSDIISVGDSIVKKPGSDSIVLFKGNNAFYFIHGKYIN